MRIRRMLSLSGIMGGTLVLAGCGVTTHAAAPSQRPHTAAPQSTVVSPSASAPTASTLASPSGTPRSSAASTADFAGHQIQRYVGHHIPSALPNGFAAHHSTFSTQTYHPVEGFTGTLKGHSFALEFYEKASVGLFVGLRYHGQPVYFGPGPDPVFDVLNFTGADVVLGTPSAGAYMALNLVTGHAITNPQQVVPLKGYAGLTAPDHVLGLPGTTYPVTVP